MIGGKRDSFSRVSKELSLHREENRELGREGPSVAFEPLSCSSDPEFD